MLTGGLGTFGYFAHWTAHQNFDFASGFCGAWFLPHTLRCWASRHAKHEHWYDYRFSPRRYYLYLSRLTLHGLDCRVHDRLFMLCTSCGADLGARVPKFCVQCGAPLTAQGPTPSFIPVTDDAPPTQESSLTPTSAEFSPLPDEVSPSNTPLQSELALQTESAPQAEWGFPPESAPLHELTPPSEPPPPLESVSAAHEPAIEPLFPFSADSPLFTNIQGRREPVIGFSQAEQRFPLPNTTPWASFPKRRSVVPGIAAVALVIILAGVWWGMSGESASPLKTEKESPPALSATGTDVPAQVPAQELSESIPPPADAMPGTGTEPSILNLPSLPSNQAGRHNSTATGGEAVPPLSNNSAPQRPLPILMPSSPPPPPPAISPPPALSPPQARISIEPRPLPAEKFPIRPEQPLATRADNTEADAPPSYDDDRDSIVMLERMRKKLANCQDFFCRSRVRRQYCTDQLKSLPECKNSSL
jgi:hypothetical protein